MRLRRCWWGWVAVHRAGAGAVKALGARPYLRLDLRQLRHRLHFCQHPGHYDSRRLCLGSLLSNTFTLSQVSSDKIIKKLFQTRWDWLDIFCITGSLSWYVCVVMLSVWESAHYWLRVHSLRAPERLSLSPAAPGPGTGHWTHGIPLWSPPSPNVPLITIKRI